MRMHLTSRVLNSCKRGFPVIAIVAILAAVVAQGARPQVAIRSTFVYPRSDLTTAEALVWRGQLAVHHQIGTRLSWHLLGDITPATLTRSAGARLYSGYIQARLTPAWRVTLGRQAYWNSLHTARFDGLTLERRRGAPGDYRQLTFYAGFTPSSGLGNDYNDAGTIDAGGALRRAQGNLTWAVQAWTTERDSVRRAYLGGSLRIKIGSRLTQIADLAVDLTQPAAEKVRLRTRIRLSHRANAFLQYRQTAHLTLSPYPWMTDTTFAPRQILSAGVCFRPMKKILLRLSFNQRRGQNLGRYIAAQVSWGSLSLAWQSQEQAIYGGQHLQFSGQRALTPQLKVGGSVGTSRYALYDEQSLAVEDLEVSREDRSALAAACWVQGRGWQRLSYRLFAQYTQNRYFAKDGRIGLQLSYAL